MLLILALLRSREMLVFGPPGVYFTVEQFALSDIDENVSKLQLDTIQSVYQTYPSVLAKMNVKYLQSGDLAQILAQAVSVLAVVRAGSGPDPPVP